MSKSSGPSHLWRLHLTLVVIGICVAPHLTIAGDPVRPKLTPQIQGVVGWLPSDTDTLCVAQSFVLRTLEHAPNVKLPVPDFRIGSALSATSGLWELEGKKYLRPLADRKIIAAVHGARGAEIVSNFGSLRSEGCSVVVFEEDLGNSGRDWSELLRQGARQVRQIDGHEVFVFPSTNVMEAWVKPAEWEGTYFVLLTSKVILSATSDKYLEEVLANLERPPVPRALPENLPEWQHVDTAAPGWMLRHVPESVFKRSIVGVTITTSKDHCRIVYLPITKEQQNPKRFIRTRWLGRDPIVDLAMPFKFEQNADGAIIVSAGMEAFEPDNALLLWRLNSLRGAK